MNDTLHEQQKKEALERMRLIGLREEFIRAFEQNGKVHLSAGKEAWPEFCDGDKDTIRRFEQEHDALVFLAVRTNLGGIYILDSLFYVSQYTEEWPMEHEDLKAGYALTYTINYLQPECTEFGSISFETTPDGEVVRKG